MKRVKKRTLEEQKTDFYLSAWGFDRRNGNRTDELLLPKIEPWLKASTPTKSATPPEVDPEIIRIVDNAVKCSQPEHRKALEITYIERVQKDVRAAAIMEVTRHDFKKFYLAGITGVRMYLQAFEVI